MPAQDEQGRRLPGGGRDPQAERRSLLDAQGASRLGGAPGRPAGAARPPRRDADLHRDLDPVRGPFRRTARRRLPATDAIGRLEPAPGLRRREWYELPAAAIPVVT